MNGVLMDLFQLGRAIVAVYNYRNGDPKPYIILTNDYGKSWKLISKGLLFPLISLLEVFGT